MERQEWPKERAVGTPKLSRVEEEALKDSELEELREATEDLLNALKPFTYLVEVMSENIMLNFRGVYVSYEQVQEAAQVHERYRPK